MEARVARVVVGVSDSLASLEALRYAVSEARRRGALLVAVRAWLVQGPGQGEDLAQWRIAAGAAAAATIRQSFDQAMGGLPHNLDLEMLAVEGAIGPVLVAQAASDGDLLVLGAPARRWWRVFPLSLVRYCVRAATCPVVVVPAPVLARKRSVKASAREMQREAQRFVATSGQLT
jgi:nucleotide-binding universal stress UspA family protein